METRLQRTLLVLIILVLTLALYRDLGGRRAAKHAAFEDQHPPLTALEPANATLGVVDEQTHKISWYHANVSSSQFGAVLAVSRPRSSRRDGLLFAANITELDISIPEQPLWTDEDVSQLRGEGVSTMSRGSALAWLGHLNALRAFLDSEYSTVLIIEDDVDWDIRLRTMQIPVAAAAFRALTSNYNADGLDHQNYWGNASSWDVCKFQSIPRDFNKGVWLNHNVHG